MIAILHQNAKIIS